MSPFTDFCRVGKGAVHNVGLSPPAKQHRAHASKEDAVDRGRVGTARKRAPLPTLQRADEVIE